MFFHWKQVEHLKDSKITVIRYRQGKYELKTRGGYSENLRSYTEDVLQRVFLYMQKKVKLEIIPHVWHKEDIIKEPTEKTVVLD